MQINNIDDEWESFLTSGQNGYSSDEGDENEEIEIMNDNEEFMSANINCDLNLEAPKATEIYISTKTKIAYLNMPINLKKLFWDIPVINYYVPKHGVVKKQMKFNSIEKSELDFIQDKLKSENYFEEHVITHIDNPSGRIKFKDIRKVSIGISKKDIMSYRCKKKSAFYNCFVIIVRLMIDNLFKEFHVKVFNTGKLEIPGIQNEMSFQMVLSEVLSILQPHVEEKLEYKPDSDETVLINSNFNCGYFINREVLYDMLKMKYNIQAIYDPCSYPGIQCKFYYNPDVGIQNGVQISEENKHLYKNIKEVSFMIFRTGSVLIVGKCDENVLMIIYEFLKNIMTMEHKSICQKKMIDDEKSTFGMKTKTVKTRRRNIMIEVTPTTA